MQEKQDVNLIENKLFAEYISKNHGWDLVDEIRLLPQEKRLSFARKHIKIIRYETQLAEIIETLFENEKSAFALENAGVCVGYFSDILRVLPESERMTYAKSYPHKDKVGVVELERIADILGTIDLEFIQPYAHILDYKFRLIITRLPQENRLELARKYYPDINYRTNTAHITGVIAALNPDDRLGFAIEKIKNVNCWSGLEKVLELLSIENKMDYLMSWMKYFDNGCKIYKNNASIQEFTFFYSIIKFLPENEKLDFCIFYSHASDIDLLEFAASMSELSQKDRLIFALNGRKCFNLNAARIIKILRLLQKEEQVIFLSKNLSGIRDKEEFISAGKSYYTMLDLELGQLFDQAVDFNWPDKDTLEIHAKLHEVTTYYENKTLPHQQSLKKSIPIAAPVDTPTLWANCWANIFAPKNKETNAVIPADIINFSK